MVAYYNDNDPAVCAWAEELIKTGVVPYGVVDCRPIQEVQPDDLKGFTQCHFFAGILGWPYALRLAGWPDDRPVWTGSCPCQPFSVAGKRGGTGDERHLWPEFRRLIEERRPPKVFGEQVASKDGRNWLAAVRADLEDLDYALGGADLCSAGIGVEAKQADWWEWLDWTIRHCPDPILAGEMRDFAHWAGGEIVVGPPNIRQRLFWMADADPGRCEDSWRLGHQGGSAGAVGDGDAGRLADAPGRRCHQWGEASRSQEGTSTGLGSGSTPHRLGNADGAGWNEGQPAAAAYGHRGPAGSDGGACGMGDAPGQGPQGQQDRGHDVRGPSRPAAERAGGEPPGPMAIGGGRPSAREQFWRAADWLFCRGGRWRPVEPSTFPLAAGLSGRVGLLRGYGNAINPVLAAEFIQASEEAVAMIRRSA